MPLEYSIQTPDGSPLGEVSEVREHILSALPGAQSQREPSGEEKLAAAQAKGIEITDTLRRAFGNRPATEKVTYEKDGLSLIISGLESDPVEYLMVENREGGDAVPALAALCLPKGWIAMDDSTEEEVDLGGG